MKLPNETHLTFATQANVFQPTLTSELCIRGALTAFSKPGTLLDLGCGCGVVGISLGRMSLIHSPVYASDVSEEAVILARHNAGSQGVAYEARVGSLFEPWTNMQFDYIVDDVSGIVEDLAILSPWFGANIPCASGPNGSDLTTQVLDHAGRYLKKDGVLLFPILSLSNRSKIISKTLENFDCVECVVSETWKIPDELASQIDILRKTKAEGRINFEEKFGVLLAQTEIFKCSRSKSL